MPSKARQAIGGGARFFQQKSPGAVPRSPWRPVLRTHGDRRGGLFLSFAFHGGNVRADAKPGKMGNFSRLLYTDLLWLVLGVCF